jgi:3-oxoacyl-[acyl-carrier-protein] synthase-3
MSMPITTPDRPAYSRILGVGAYRPARVVTNDEVCQRLDSSDEWILARSGIRTRRFAGPDESLSFMAEAAASKALADAGIAPSQVSMVLVATMTHRKTIPSVSAEVTERLRANRAAAIDVGAACAGFCYGLGIADNAIKANAADYALVIGVERMSDVVDPEDRSTAFIFGDGAGAVVVGPSTRPDIGPVIWGSDTSQIDSIRQIGLWPSVHDEPSPSPDLRMAGPQVFRWVMSEVADIARRTLDAAGVTAADLDLFIPHQANARVIDKLVAALGLSERTVVARDVVDNANTSAASVPLAIERVRADGHARSGDLALLLGFGSGMVYAGQVVRIP